MRKVYTENLLFLQDYFKKRLLEIKEALIFSLDNNFVNDFNFKNFTKNIRNYDYETESRIFSLIALQSPATKDLRFLLSLLKLNVDLVRISKAIFKISKVNKSFNKIYTIDVVLLSSFELMGKKLVLMLNQILELLNKGKISNDSARSFQNNLIESDDYIDDLFKELLSQVIKKMEVEIDSKKQAKLITETLLVVRHMERIGDHLCNIAEKIIYIETGEQLFIG
jgi:phosphate transport system protein